MRLVPKSSERPNLTVKQILAWADAHREHTGNWPTIKSGAVAAARGETWFNIDRALRDGSRGLSGGLSLFKLLALYRSVSRHVRKRPLSAAEILRWADAYRARTGGWPTARSGPIPEAPGETWGQVSSALIHGRRGLTVKMTLPQFLAEHRGKRNIQALPRYTIAEILRWADAHKARYRKWPVRTSGRITAAKGETWNAVDIALRAGKRGLPGGSSLAKLLAAKRGVPHRMQRPRLTIRQILAWADAYHDRTGKWPTVKAGPLGPYSKDTWSRIDKALRQGYRGLPGGQTLAMLMKERRRVFGSRRSR
ncbi:MAG: hypothetical protein HY000_22975 [Planctomycetes bacterium]|nr:hypothetical protein [Planctomycetota bacterium]